MLIIETWEFIDQQGKQPNYLWYQIGMDWMVQYSLAILVAIELALDDWQAPGAINEWSN